MKNEFFKDTRLLDAIDHIDSDLIAETADKIRPPAAPKREAEQSKKTKVFTAWKQAAALVACALLMGAIIPAISMLVGNINPTGTNPGEGISPSGGESENLETEHDSLTDESNGAEETGAPTERVSDGSEGLEYQVNADGESASFIGFGTCTEENVVIATTFMGLPVTQMRNEALLCGVDAQYCGSNYAKSITVSDTVEEIYQGIFDLCPNLESIYIGTNVNFIRPFVANTWEGHILAEFKVSPDNIYFSDNGNCLIEKQSKTLIVACKNSVIPDDGSVEIIGDSAFYCLKPVNPIVIPDCIKRIEYHAFAGCNVFECIVLPKNLEYLGVGAFEACSSLKSVDLNGFTKVPESAFSGASALSEIKGLEYVTEIGRSAFNACNCLTSVCFGTSLESIGKHAFAGTPWKATVYYSGTVAQWNEIEKDPEWFVYPIEYPESPLREIVCSDGIAKP